MRLINLLGQKILVFYNYTFKIIYILLNQQL